MKQGIEIATTDVLGKKIEPKLVVGTYNGYGSGEIFDANAVSDLVDARISEIVNLAPEAFDTLGEIAEILNVKQDYISDLEQIRNGAYLGATSYLCPTEGIPYEDLSEGVLVLLDKANTAIQNHQDVSNKVNISDLSAVAFSGSYLDLSYLPTIPTRVSLLANDAGYLTQHQDISYKANRSELFSRDYNDLLNKPTIPVVPTNISAFNNDVGYLTQHQDISGLLQLIPDLETIRSGAALGATSIQEHLSLSDYLLKAAISDWAKLSTKPTYNLDEVTDGSTRKLSNYYTKQLTESLIPTNVSAFTNDVPYLTAHQSISHLLPIAGAFIDVEYKSKKLYKTKYNNESNQVELEIVSASTLVDDGGGVKQANVSSSTPTLSWGATSKIGSVGSVDFSVKMPANPNTNTAGLYVIDKANKKVSTVESPAQFILFTGGENKFSIKDHNNLSFDVNITPYIENCVTGSSLTNNTVILGGGDSTISSSGKQIQTSISNSNSYIPTSKAVVSYVTSQLASVLTYKGTIGTSDATVTELPATHKVGDVYVVSTAGTFAGKACEIGDYIICRIAGTVANDSHWDVVSGENQVDNKQASLASAGSSATIAAVDGTNITITTPSTWTGLTKTGTITKVGNTTSGIVTVSSGENTATYNGFCTVGTVGGIDLRFKMPAKPTLVASDIPDLSGTYVTLAGALTITGGKTFSGTNASILTIDRNSTSIAWIKFAKNGTLSGYLGVSNNHKAMFHDGTDTYEIWHGGNFTPSDYLPLSGGTMTGGITMGTASSGFNDKGILFGTNGSAGRIGGNITNLGIYSAGSLYLRPDSASTTSSTGVIISSSTVTYNGNTIWHAGNDGSDSGLDADLLDGLHSSAFARLYTKSVAFGKGVRIYCGATYGAMIFGRSTSGTTSRITLIGTGYSFTAGAARNHWRCIDKGGYVEWTNASTTARSVEIMNTNTVGTLEIFVISPLSDVTFTDITELSGTAVTDVVAMLSSNVASATKLQTARTIWGQDFDGTANVSGAITGVTTISASGNVSIGGTLDVTGAITATGGVIGNASSATNIAGGTEGSIPYQTAAGTTAFLSGSSSNGYVLAYNTTTKAPYWKSDANTALRVYRQTTGYDADYPLIASRTATIGTAGTNSSYSSVYGVISDTAENVPTVNPSTGLVKVKELNVSGDTVSSYGKVLFNGYEFVDLGLPSGNLWATCNIGASSQELIGLYFAWGAETGYAKGDEHNFNKAVSEFSDTIHVEMSALWEFPSPSDFGEIENNCTKTWTTINNIPGYKFTSNQNGNTIFFPAGGYYNGTTLNDEKSRGRYWTNTASSSLSGYATGFLFISGTTYYSNVYDIKWGFNVRGVVRPSRLSSILDNMYRINDLDNRVSDLE